MFYSQFILAKKGPLGTIWIAAHLERKLRKNQVADTDIGVSVDTILCPEVPIALRLSSHLLLGVVRIYSRKVNYLFDDCSEALLKIKQAFRSTAVDLPPEESKAPYHSITLPETFDLDDFELPDNEFFQGNYVDHHTSTREQITLQDNMEGVVYPTSQFGLDERFGDGETSGLKLDEEFFLHKVDSAGHAGVSGDHQSFAEAATPMQDDGHGRLPALPESRVEILNVERDLMDYAQAPCTPGLVETPNLANIQFSACDDHMDEDDNPLVEFMLNGNAETISSKLSQHQENAQLVDWSLSDDINSIAAVDIPCEENGNHFIDLETEKRHSPNETRAQNISSDNPATASGTSFAVADEAQGSGQTSNLTQMAVSVSTLLYKKQDLENVILKGDGVNVPSVSNEDYRESNGIVFNGSAQNAVCSIASLQIPEGVSDDNQTTMFGEKSDMEVSGNPGGCISSNGGALELSQGLSSLENPHDIHTSNVSVCNEMTYPQVHVLRPCSTSLGLPNSFHPGGQVPNDLNMAPDVGAIPLESFGGGEMIHASEPAIVVQEGKLELNLEENYTAEPVSVEDIHVGSGISDNQRNNNLGGGSMLENATSSVSAVFPAPEKLLSLPEGHTNQQRGPLLDATPTDLACPDESDAGSRILPGKKRSYTASSLTEQSLYSVESARVFPTKRTSRAVPDDDDLLSSILVGRSSSVLKVKPTPPPYELTSLKRRRYTPRTSVSKRKVLLDDTMVLHGGTIRQQLIDTEDIRRLRKKAPCTLPEISSMRNQFLEDELFIEPLSSGVSVALGSLFNQGYDLSRIKVSKGVANVVSVLSSSDMKFISSNESTKNVTDSAPPVVETGVGDCGEFAAVKENCDLQHNKTISLTKNKLDEGHEMGSSITDLEINPKENKEVAEPTSSLSNLPNKLAGNEIGGTNTPSESVGVAQLTFPVIGVEADALVEMEAAVVSFDSKTMSENVVEPAVVSFDSKTVSENVVEPAVVSFDRKTVSENVVEPAVVSFDSKVESENVVEAAVVSFDNKVESENVNEAADDSFDDKGETENVMQEAVVSFDDKGGPENVMEAAVVSLDDQRESENVMEAAVVSCVDKTEAANVMMDASFVNGQRNVDDERFVTVKVIDTGTAVEVAPNERDPVLLEGGPQCAGSVEFDEYYGEQVQDDARGMSVEIETNTSMEECNEPLCGGTSSEILASLLLSQFRDVQGSCLNNGDYLIRHEGCPTNADGVEISGIDMQDYDDFNYAAAAANDTDFLNADEDEEAEFTDDHIPNAEETRVTDNSGWSSRTRAVASYLQTLFMREAEHDRKILPMENLLLGKTRKEASRMFFETLVLKTKDYVQVEQECPFQNINIKPKMKLLKSDF